MNLIISIISALVAIFSVIIIHELGHFCVARWCGVKVLKFSIGFGKALWTWHGKSGTEYVLGLLPLGGYVKMLGEDDEVQSNEDMRFAYHRKSIWARMAIIVAGPLTNFLLAIVLFGIVFSMGVVRIKPIVGEVAAGSIAQKANLQVGDQIVKINGSTTNSWQRVIIALVMKMGEKGTLNVTVQPKNQNQPKELQLQLMNWKVDTKNPDLLGSLGITPFQPHVPTLVAALQKGSPGEQAGLKPGDRILTVNGKHISDWSEFAKVVHDHPGVNMSLQVQRQQKLLTFVIPIGSHKGATGQYGYLGVLSQTPNWPKDSLVHLNYNLLTAWYPALVETWTITAFNAEVLTRMIMGKISLRSLGGPIMIFQTAGRASKIGISAYLSFVAFISVTLGFINLLPIPGLDGGHLLFHIIEGVRRKPVSEKYQRISFAIGFSLLILLMVQATLNDILRLF